MRNLPQYQRLMESRKLRSAIGNPMRCACERQCRGRRVGRQSSGQIWVRLEVAAEAGHQINLSTRTASSRGRQRHIPELPRRRNRGAKGAFAQMVRFQEQNARDLYPGHDYWRSTKFRRITDLLGARTTGRGSSTREYQTPLNSGLIASPAPPPPNCEAPAARSPPLRSKEHWPVHEPRCPAALTFQAVPLAALAAENRHSSMSAALGEAGLLFSRRMQQHAIDLTFPSYPR